MKKIMKITAFLGACLMVTSCDALAGLGLGGSSKDIKNEIVKEQRYNQSVKGSKFDTTYSKDIKNNVIFEMLEDEKYDDLIFVFSTQSYEKESVSYPNRKDTIDSVEIEKRNYEYKYDADNSICEAVGKTEETYESLVENYKESSEEKVIALQQKKEVLMINEASKTYTATKADIEDFIKYEIPSSDGFDPYLLADFDSDGHGTEYYVDDHLYTIVFEEEEEENNYDYLENYKYTGTIQISFKDNAISILVNTTIETLYTDWDTEVTTTTIEQEIQEVKIELKEVKLKSPDLKKYTEVE